MSGSLATGVTGLTVHQRMLDVVANNIANINTTGYKQQQIQFADLFYSNVAGAEIGSGAQVNQVRRNLGQGNLDATGESLDFAIRGQGYFVVNDGTRNMYTRAGAFALDQEGFLVDPNTGAYVQRFGDVGETDGTSVGFQDPDSTRISIPLGTAIFGQATETVNLNGNLNLSADVSAAEVATSATPLTVGGVAATNATLLNDLDGNTVNYVGGDSLVLLGTDADASTISLNIPVDGTTTVGDLITSLSSSYPNATAALDASGNITLTADATGPTALTLSLADDPGNTGASTMPIFSVTTEGQNGGIVQSSVEIFDLRGEAHTLSLQFERVSNSGWTLTTSLPPGEGTITTATTFDLVFNDSGGLASIDGDGSGQIPMTFNFDGITAPQSIIMSLASAGTLSGITQLAAEPSLAAEQDGFAPGTLSDVVMSEEGTLYGVASNGRRFPTPIAQLAIASFRNEQGLSNRGDNYLTETPDSGEAQLGAGLTGGRGSLASGRLESANVDIALEFTRLIVAQRGFSANARTITVSNEVLEELNNVVR